MRALDQKKIYRIVDANYNRAKEALRVCEDVARFFLSSSKTTQSYKTLRHGLRKVFDSLCIQKGKLLEARDAAGDVGRENLSSEFSRKDIQDIFFANSQRAKESVRVLEELAKLLEKKSAEDFKKIRYTLYTLERGTFKKF